MQPILGGPRAGLTEQDVLESLDPAHAPRVRSGAVVLSSRDHPTGETALVDLDAGGEVRWSFRSPDAVGGASPTADAVRRTARVSLVGPTSFTVESRRLLLWVEMQAPSGVWVRWHLGVFVVPSPALRDDGTALRRDLDLADKSYRWAARTLVNTLRIPAGTNAVSYVRGNLGSLFGESQFALPASGSVLVEPMTFEAGTSVLTVYNALLQAVGFDSLTADEDGRPMSLPLAEVVARRPEVTYGPGSPIVTAGTVESLIPTVPNVLRFVARAGPSLPEVGNGIAERRNQRTGPASIEGRGEEIHQTVDVDADSQAALEAVASAESQRIFAGGGLRFTGRVGLNPRFSDQDVIGLRKPRLGLAGAPWVVTDWTLPLGVMGGEGAALMDVTCEQRVES